MAIRGQKGTQLQLLMTGTELKDSITQSHDKLDTESMKQMWRRKSKESKLSTGTTYPDPYNEGQRTAHGTGLSKSMENHGYIDANPRSHIQVDHDGDQRNVWEGHHRIATAARLEKNGKGPFYIPVQHHDQTDIADDWDD